MEAILQRTVAAELWRDRAQHAMAAWFDRSLVRYDAWWVVLVAIVLVLGAGVLGGLAIWCLTTGRGRFTGNFRFGAGGVSISVECR